MDDALLAAIRRTAIPLPGGLGDYDEVLDAVGGARVVLLGDGTHGTDEFYRERALLTRRLIAEKGFTGVAVEADWPDAYRVNRFVRGISSDESAHRALEGFGRFPTWLWRNAPVLELVDWLARYNEAHKEAWDAVGFYGLDLYSLYASIQAVVDYLEARDPEAAARAKERYACLGDPAGEPLEAGSCEAEVALQLSDLMRERSRYQAEDEVLAEDEFFFAEQNARLVKNAEAYYRTMYRGGVSSWNLRDRHMMDTLNALMRHLGARGEPPKLVVWAHNSHLGDARATSMGRAGEWNLGQLVREEYGDAAFLVGFTTFQGEVTAADDWGARPKPLRVRRALPESYEALFHRAALDRFALVLRDAPSDLRALWEERLERMIGVVYRPMTERQSHYFSCCLPRQFDAVVHLDQTRALEPLDRAARREDREPSEAFPSGL